MTKFKAIARLWAISALIWGSNAAQATTLLGMDIDQIVNQAELIFEGEVIERKAFQDASSGIINTYITFKVVEVIKGSAGGGTLELKFAGGEFEGNIVEVSGSVLPALNESGVYFVESATEDMLNPLLGWTQGHFKIATDEGERRIFSADSKPVIQVQPMAGVPTAIKAPRALIQGKEGVAAGVLTQSSPLTVYQALTVEQFKQRIRAMIE
jgi:hypothetical protein